MAIVTAVGVVIFDHSIFWEWFTDGGMGDPHANRTRLLSGLVEITHPGAVPGSDDYTYLWGSGFGYDANSNTYTGTIDYFARANQPNNVLPGFNETVRVESTTSLNINLNDFMFAPTPEARFDLVFSGNDTFNWNGKEVIGGFEGGAGADTFNGSGRTDDEVTFREQASEGILIDLATPSLNTNDAAGDTYNAIDQFSLSEFNDYAYGDAGNNNLNGRGGSDYIDGRDGDDTIVGGQSIPFFAPDGVDTLYGGAGNDLILGGAGNDFIQGGAGNDELNGTSFGNIYEGGDILSLADATSSVVLALGVDGDGTVTADGTGTDTFVHFDHVEGGSASDNISGNHRNNILWGFGGVDTLNGTGGNDTLYGGADSDFLYGGNDDDTLVGEGGIDEMYGEAGNDRFIFGAADANVLGVSDFIRGGTHTTRDIIEVQAPVIPGPAEPYEPEFIDLRNFNIDGVEALQITSGQAVVRSWDLNHVQYNTFTGSSLTATGRIGTIIGGNGANMLTLTARTADYNPGNIEVSFAPLLFESWNAAEDLVFITSDNGMRTVIGTSQRDYMVGAIAGGTFGTILAGGDGDDTIVGSSVNDVHYNGLTGGLDGGNGNDTIFGGGGNDGIDGGAGNDRLYGDAGNDVFLYFGSPTNNFDVFNGGSETDTAFFGYFGSAVWADLGYAGIEAWTSQTAIANFSNATTAIADLNAIENLTGSDFADYLKGSAASTNALRGGSGNDVLAMSATAAAGTVDVLNGGADSDTADFSAFGSAVWVDLGFAGPSGIEAWTSNTSVATSANSNVRLADLVAIENVTGTVFADYLQGTSSANILSGGAGNDRLLMSAAINAGAVDKLDGGGDTDTADFSTFGSAVWVDLSFGGTEAWTSNSSVATNANANTQLADLALVENVTGTGFSDYLRGNAATNVLSGGTGNDRLLMSATASSGTVDTLDGGANTDTADFSTFGAAVWVNLGYAGIEAYTSGTSVATNFNANTKLADLALIENVTGSNFSDYLRGSTAIANTLTGGGGADSFVFGDTWGADTITDFQDTIDRIDLSAVTGLNTFSQLTVSAISGGTATVSYAGQSITLTNLALGTVLNSADFIV